MVLVGVTIGVVMFAALFALLRESYRDTGQDSPESEHTHLLASDATECLLCRAPLPHVGTPDEAVTEIERNIESDREAARGLVAGIARSIPRCGA